MRLFIKILLFVFVALITNVKVISAATTFIDIQRVTTSFSILDETPEIDFKVIENDLANCCQNEWDLVDYRNRGIVVEENAVKGGSSWVYGAFKSEAKWAGQLSKRGWTTEQITEAVTKGKSFDAVNMVNKANSATRYVHPTTGQSVVIDKVTKELLHVGGKGFKY